MNVDDEAIKKRWCPIFEILFRAGAVVQNLDDPFAGLFEDFRGPLCGIIIDKGEL